MFQSLKIIFTFSLLFSFNQLIISQNYHKESLLKLAKKIEETHPSLKGKDNNKEWGNLLEEVSNAKKMSKIDYTFFVSKIVSLTKDPHTSIKNLTDVLNPVPLFVNYYDDGWIIIGTNEFNKKILGNKILSINDIPISNVISQISKIMPCSNESCIKAFLPSYIFFPQFFSKLNMKSSLNSLTIELEDAEGNLEKVNLNTISYKQWEKELVLMRPHQDLLMNKNRNEAIWSETINNYGLHYVKINSFNGKKESFKKIANSIYKLKDNPNVKKIVIDVRNNLGGQSQMGYPILKALIESSDLKLYLIINHNSFSASIAFTELVKKYTNALIIGSPYGDTSNHFSEPTTYTVNEGDININVSISSKYFHNAMKGEDSYLKNLKYVASTFKDLKNKNDLILEYIKRDDSPLQKKKKLTELGNIESYTTYPQKYIESYDFYLAQQANISNDVFGNKSLAIDLCKKGLKINPKSPYLLGTLGLIQFKKWNFFGGASKLIKALRYLNEKELF